MKYRITLECLDTGVAVEREVEEKLSHEVVLRSLFEMLFPALLDYFLDQLEDQRHHELQA